MVEVRAKSRSEPMLIVFVLLAWLANVLSLAAADWVLGSVDIDGWWPLLLGAAVLGIANTMVKPIVTLLTLPLVIVTLGLALFAINVAMLSLSEWVAPDFSIDGFWTYVGATIIVWLVNSVLHGLFGLKGERETTA
jgi:putative membrane protein